MMRPLLVHGARAVRSGRVGETILEAVFAAYGVKVVNDNPVYHHAGGDLYARADMLLIRQYRHKRNLIFDFLYKDFARNITLPIECKQQMGSGTTDQKLAYVVDALAQCGHVGFWIVLSGGGFNPDLTKIIDAKIRSLPQIRGRLLFNAGALLQRAIERLVENGEM